MKYGIDSAQMVDVSRVFLDQENPRHEPFADQEEVIAYLCEEEQVLPMAKDIATHGLNPLELFALLPDGKDTYVAAEGNRRLCAIQLLNDPDLAPANLRNEFIKAAGSWQPVKQLFAAVFKRREDVRLWLDRIHAGQADGRGRRQWKADQKARNSGYTKNNLALALLDYAEQANLITAEGRKGRLSTVQRYTGNPIFRDALGLDDSLDGQPTTNVSPNDFERLFGKFMEDVASKELTTRVNADNIKDYAHKLGAMDGLDRERHQRRSIEPPKPKPVSGRPRIKPPLAPTKVVPNDDLRAALEDIPSYKLQQLYFSLCSLRLANHTPLLTIGAWSFLETLTAICDRKSSNNFYSFLSSVKLQSLGLGSKQEVKSITEAVKRISELGNSTKHNKISTSFNGPQLANDLETMTPMLLALAREAKGKT